MGLFDWLFGNRAVGRHDGPRTVTATVDGVVVAESDETIRVEGNDYFPPMSVRWEHFAKVDRHTVCPWKGVASYYDVTVGDRQENSAAWTYHEPSEAAERLKNYVAFYKRKGVRID